MKSISVSLDLFPTAKVMLSLADIDEDSLSVFADCLWDGEHLSQSLVSIEAQSEKVPSQLVH